MEFQGVVGDGERGWRERDAEQNRLDYLRDQYYTRWFYGPTMLRTSAGQSNVSSLIILTFADAASQIARSSFLKPTHWRNGSIRLDVYWGTSTTHTGTVELDVELYGHAIDATAGGGRTTLYTAAPAFTWNGSGTANYFQKGSITTTSNVTDDMKFVTGVFTRDGVTDTNTGVLYIAAISFTFQPSNRQ